MQIEPITRSENGFCQGVRGAIMTKYDETIQIAKYYRWNCKVVYCSDLPDMALQERAPRLAKGTV